VKLAVSNVIDDVDCALEAVRNKSRAWLRGWLTSTGAFHCCRPSPRDQITPRKTRRTITGVVVNDAAAAAAAAAAHAGKTHIKR
jgi:hypothetical protein